MSEAKARQKDAILKMVGTSGWERLEAICNIAPKEHSYRDPYRVACHILNVGLDRLESEFRISLGIESSEGSKVDEVRKR